MSARHMAKKIAYLLLPTIILAGCFKPPYNNFEKDPAPVKKVVAYTATGTVIGAAAGSPTIGAAIGGSIGVGKMLYEESRTHVISALSEEDIQFIEYGDTITLIVPTDRYFLFDSERLNDICYKGLNNIVKMLNFYPHSTFYIAGFADNVGAWKHKKHLTDARAEAMLTFLWAHNIRARKLHAAGYADSHAIGDNHVIRGSAYNRRLEIQWLKIEEPAKSAAALNDKMNMK